jgi:hypothetical protein
MAFALQLRKKHGKTSVRVAIHKHTMRNKHTSVGFQTFKTLGEKNRIFVYFRT